MKKKFDLSKLQNAHGVPADKLFPTLSTPFDACQWGINDSGTGRLIERKPVSGMPQDLEGKRRYLAQLMPRLKDPNLVRALEVMLANDLHVQSYCQPYQPTQAQSTRRPRPGGCQAGKNLCTEPKWCVELAALAVGEAMALVESVSDPLGETGHQTVTRQLTALSTWLWEQEAFEQRFLHTQAAQTARKPLDEFDQTDPYEDDHITKVIGEDGEAVRLRPARYSATPVAHPGELSAYRLVMLRDLALHEALYARVLAQAWDIPLEQIGLEPDLESCRKERLLLAHVLCWSRSANQSVQARHTHGRRRGHPGRKPS